MRTIHVACCFVAIALACDSDGAGVASTATAAPAGGAARDSVGSEPVGSGSASASQPDPDSAATTAEAATAETPPVETPPAEAEPAEPERPPRLPAPLTVLGFATPECVIYFAEEDVYLVSNIDGDPTAEDDNGFISRVSPDGEVLDRQWAGTEGTYRLRLNAPKGLAIAGGDLLIADIDRVVTTSVRRPRGGMDSALTSWEFVNDIASDGPGRAVISDTKLGWISMFQDGHHQRGAGSLMGFESSKFNLAEGLGKVNGVAFRGEEILYVTATPGGVYRLGLEWDDERGWFGVPEPVFVGEELPDGLDGLVVLSDGRLLISSWDESAVFEVSADGEWKAIVTEVKSPADIGYDPTRNTLLIPSFETNTVILHPLP